MIDYLPFGTRCREPRAEYTSASPDLLTWADPRSDEVEALVLHPELVPPGHKLVYTAYLRGKGAERTSVGVPRLAKGPVRACERVPGGPTITPDGGLRFEGPASPTN